MRSEPYEKKRLKLMADNVAGGSVLDIGYADLPNPYLGSRHTVGYDLAEPRGPSGYDEQVLGDVREIGQKLAGRRFDTILAGELIEHLEDPYTFLRDLHTLLADGGRLVISTPNPLGFPVVVAEILRLKKFFYAGDHTFYFLPRWMDRMLTLCNFQINKIVPVGLWLPYGPIPWSPVSMSYQVIYVAEVR